MSGVRVVCEINSAFLHYFMLVYFGWTSAECINLYLKLVKVWGGSDLVARHYVLKAGAIIWCKFACFLSSFVVVVYCCHCCCLLLFFVVYCCLLLLLAVVYCSYCCCWLFVVVVHCCLLLLFVVVYCCLLLLFAVVYCCYCCCLKLFAVVCCLLLFIVVYCCYCCCLLLFIVACDTVCILQPRPFMILQLNFFCITHTYMSCHFAVVPVLIVAVSAGAGNRFYFNDFL